MEHFPKFCPVFASVNNVYRVKQSWMQGPPFGRTISRQWIQWTGWTWRIEMDSLHIGQHVFIPARHFQPFSHAHFASIRTMYPLPSPADTLSFPHRTTGPLVSTPEVLSISSRHAKARAPPASCHDAQGLCCFGYVVAWFQRVSPLSALFHFGKYVVLRHLLKSSETDANSFKMQAH